MGVVLAIVDWVAEALVDFRDYLVAVGERVLDVVIPVVLNLLDTVGVDLTHSDLQLVADVTARVNYWVPLDTAVQLSGAYITLWTGALTVRLLRRLNPFSG